MFIDVGYSVPGRGLSLDVVDHVNAAVQSAIGYSVFGYFKFFQEEDAASLLNNNVCFPSPIILTVTNSG